MNAQPQATKETKDDLAKNGEKFADKLGKFINPFYVSFVIFWVICNYDFLLILIGKKAILHDLYAHFGYGCGVGKINLFGYCTKKSSTAYSGYFLIWKVAIPLGLTWLHAHFVYPVVIANINTRDKLNKENEGRAIRTNADLLKMIEERDSRIAELEEEFMKANPQNP